MNTENQKEEKKLKIAYIIPRFLPFKGGAEQNTYALASRMAKEGHDVTVITTNVKFRNEELPKEETIDGIKIIRNWALNNALYAGFYPELLPLLIRSDFDVIHTSGFGFIWREFCLTIKKVLSPKTKFVCTPHGPFMAVGANAENKSGLRAVIKDSYTFVLQMLLPWLYNYIVQVTPNQTKWLNEEYHIPENKIILVPNGVDRAMLEKELVEHSPEEKLVLSFTGRHEWYKGVQDVLRALGKLVASGENNFEFVIMGRSGNYTQKLKDIIEELQLDNYIRFIYSPTDEQRDELLYSRSQIHILPSRWEATGIVLIEAMAKGNVIITTNQNEGADLLIKEGESGFKYNFGDVDALATILKVLLDDANLRQRIRQQNLQFAKNFTWEEIFPNYLQKIKELVG